MTTAHLARVATAMIAGLATVVGAHGAPAGAATPTIEQGYAAAGPWAVDTLTVDSRYVVVHPADLGAGGARHPIVTWGNGSNAGPDRYTGVMRHLASWGFVVIASTSTTTASGTEMLQAARHLVAENDDPASRFAGTLDPTRVAAAGHSQGAGGAARATLASHGLIRTVVPINPPDPFWIPDADEVDVSLVTVPVLLLGGVLDTLISPPRTLTGYYNRIPGAAVRASLRAADHNTIQDTGGGYLGYLTAWLRYQLSDDAGAGAAFRGAQPELLRNPAWHNQAAKHLDRPQGG
jgi:pimeloyl-ACP methyl ester carboxylesterase